MTFPENPALIAGRDDDVEIRVLGMELDITSTDAKAFDGRFVFHERHDDITGIGCSLPLHDDEISGEDARARHALAVHAKRKELLRSVSRLDRDVTVEILDRGAQRTRLHAPENGYEPGGFKPLELR